MSKSKSISATNLSLLSLLILCLSVTLPNISSASTAYATQITKANAAQLVQQGPDAIGGIGDWFISNGTLCAIVSDIDHQTEFSITGGVLVDLGFCDRADDHYSFSQDLIGGRDRPVNAHTIELEQTETSASIIVSSSTPGVAQTTRYTLALTAPTELAISKRIKHTSDGESFNLYTPFNFNYHSLEAFVFSSKNLANSTGFKHEDFVSRGTSAITDAARPADTIITISPPTAVAPIAYGWHLKSAQRVEKEESDTLPSFMLADNESNAFLILPDTFYLGSGTKLGYLQVPQIPLLSLDEDSTLEIEEIIYVGNKGDVASVTDQLLKKHLSNTQRISGRVNNANSAIHVNHLDGTPLTHIRPNNDGTFSATLPSGEYRLRHLGSAYRSNEKKIKIDQQDLNLGLLQLPETAYVNLPKEQAMRLVFVGINGTKNPNFADTFTATSVVEEDGLHYPDIVSQVFLAGLNSDQQKVAIAPGQYRVYATRGPEYSLEKTEIKLATGSTTKLNIKTPTRVIETPHYIASDLHVHAGQSFDNTFSDRERVRTFVAEHGEVMVSSEHDVPVDFAPLISEMGAAEKITSIAATEVTSLLHTDNNPFTGGHTNFFPVHPDEHAFRRGMINHEDKRLREIMHEMRHAHPNVLVQLNHPRTNLTLSGTLPDDHEDLIDAAHYLEHMGSAGFPYNPEKPLQDGLNKTLIEADPKTGVRDLDFDLLEVINPGGPDHEERLQAVRKDWLSFLLQGERIVATANSDSHGGHQQVAIPRTMVAMQDDRVTHFKESEFLSSLKSGNAYGTTGPMINISLSGKQMGETFTGERGQLKLTIQSTSWINIDSAHIQINGETVATHPVKTGKENTLLIPLSFNQDSFVTVEITGQANDDYATVYPGITPYAFSTPIYVDYNADGQWQAPGL